MSDQLPKARESATLYQLHASVGHAPRASDWIPISQAMIDAFATVTGDDAFIHVDPSRAESTRFHGTIAHGLLTLSLLPKLMRSATPQLEGTRMGVNYGYDRVRFLEPVPVGSSIRALVQLAKLTEKKPLFFIFDYDVSVEIAGNDRPALKARWLLGRWMMDP
jgi:acyl dehydratase